MQNLSKSPSRKLYDRKYYETSCEGFDKTVDDASPRLAIFDSWIKKELKGNVLDLGFGRGELSIKSARIPEVEKVWAIDYSPDAGILMFENLKSEPDEICEKICAVVDDFVSFITKLDVEFDSVIWFDSLEHIHKDQIEFMAKKINEKLKVGGKIFISTPLSSQPCNERHVWMAKNTQELQDLFPIDVNIRHVGYAGVGEENWFEGEKLS